MNPTEQALWDQPLYKLKYDNLLKDTVVPSEKARLLAVASPHSSDWLTAFPSSNLGLKLENKSLRIAAGLRLGAPIVHPFKYGNCGMIVDTTGRHGL